MKTLQEEVQDVLDELWGDAHAEEPWHTKFNHVVREFTDVVRRWMVGVDSKDQQSDLVQLKREIESMVNDAIASASVKPPPLIRPFIGPVIKAAIEWAVEESTEINETVDVWILQTLVPLLKELHVTVGEAIEDLER